MPHRLALFGARIQLDRSRQPSRLTALDALVRTLEELSLGLAPTPYGLTWAQRDELLRRLPALQTGCEGPAAALDGSHLYRLQSMSSLRGLHAKVNNGRRDDEEHRIQSARSRNAEASGGWLPLTDVIRGSLRGYRDITWWTNFDLSLLHDIRDGALKLGLPLDWVHARSIILRCRSELASTKRVPTVLDAFDSPVFLATPDDASSAVGTAIDLSDPKALTLGERECVLPPLDAQQVEFKPVFVDDIGVPRKTAGATYSVEHMLLPDSSLWGSLTQLYSRQMLVGS